MKKLLVLAFLMVLIPWFVACVPQHTTSVETIEQAPPKAGKPKDLNRIVSFSVVGKGVEPETALSKSQALLMAEKAAVADGYRQFVEKIKGVYVDAMMAAGYGQVDKDMVETRARAVLRGAELKEIRHTPNGIAEAHMALRVNFTRHGIIWWPEGLGKDVSYATPVH